MDDSSIRLSEDGLEDCLKAEESENNEAFRRKRKKKMMLGDGENPVCPINERNVENILDRTLLVTESLQQLLGSYKDDLKRAGGGQTLTGSQKITGIKKRIEIAKNMTKAYINYQRAIDDIAELGRSEEFEDGDDDEYDDVEDDYYDDSFGKDQEVDDDSENLPMRSNQMLVEKKSTPKRSEPPRNYPTPSRFSDYDDPSRSWREEMVAAKENNYWCNKDVHSGEGVPYGMNVLDDLWMSCEPGSDDETIYNVGFPKGGK